MRKRKYVKINTDIFENRKLKLIDNMEKRDMIEIVWIKLLIEATKTNDSGLIYLEEDIPYTIEMLSIVLGRSKEDIQLALKVLIDLKMIELTKDKFINVYSWRKYYERKVKEEEVKEEKDNNKKSNFKVNKIKEDNGPGILKTNKKVSKDMVKRVMIR